MQTAVLVLAAGRGERLGRSLPKAFVPLAGTTLLVRSLERMLSISEIDWVQPVVAAADLPRYAASAPCAGAGQRLRPPVAGGAERQDSVAAGLAALPVGVELVAVHDAARCLVEADDVRRVIAAARRCGAALLATPARDTIKRVRDGVVVETPARSECWIAQTPQVFRVELLREAIAKARAEGVLGTDDAELVERLGQRVEIVQGSPGNLKITLPEDLEIAELRLRAARGSGEEG